MNRKSILKAGLILLILFILLELFYFFAAGQTVWLPKITLFQKRCIPFATGIPPSCKDREFLLFCTGNYPNCDCVVRVPVSKENGMEKFYIRKGNCKGMCVYLCLGEFSW